MSIFTKKEKNLLRKLNTPAKIQDFLNALKWNNERNGDTLKSPIRILRTRSAHCLEGAILGAYLLSLHGWKPYIMYLKSTKNDYDHTIAPFKINGHWGALSKTNHAVLRYREPVYKNIRELVMSYFHEYFLPNGRKTLRQYSALLNLNSFEKNWATDERDLWGIDEELDKLRHFSILPRRKVGVPAGASGQKNKIIRLRKADKLEIKAGNLVEYKND